MIFYIITILFLISVIYEAAAATTNEVTSAATPEFVDPITGGHRQLNFSKTNTEGKNIISFYKNFLNKNYFNG